MFVSCLLWVSWFYTVWKISFDHFGSYNEVLNGFIYQNQVNIVKGGQSVLGAQFKPRCVSSWLSLVKPKHQEMFLLFFFLILIFLSSKFVFLLCFCSFTADNSYSHFHSKRESRKMDSPVQAISISKQANLHRFQGLGIILCGLKLIPLIPWLYP